MSNVITNRPGNVVYGGRAYASCGGRNVDARIQSGGRIDLYDQSATPFATITIETIDLAVDLPEVTEALHKLAEQSERNTRLAANLTREQNAHAASVAALEEVIAEKTDIIESLEQALADEKATVAALATECDSVRAELADRNSVFQVIKEGQRLTDGLHQALNALHQQIYSRPSYVNPTPPRMSPSSDVCNILRQIDKRTAALATRIGRAELRKEDRNRRKGRD